MVGLKLSVNRGGRHVLQPGRHGGGNRPNLGGELGPRPLDDGRPPPQLLELDRRRAARHGPVPDVVLIECRYGPGREDRKSTRLNSSHEWISYAVFCLKKKTTHKHEVVRIEQHKQDTSRL